MTHAKIRISSLIVPVLFALYQPATFAFSANVGLFVDDEYHEVIVPNFLIFDEDNAPKLNLNARVKDPDQIVIDAIKPGIPIHIESTQKQIAGELAKYPESCRDDLVLDLMIEPVVNIDRYLPNVKDKRRITMINIYGCLARTPLECSYALSDNGAITFDIGDLTKHLKFCRLALERDIKAGKPFAAREAAR